MTTENKIIKVKDTSVIGRAIIVMCLFPIIFMFISIQLDLNYLWTFLITLTVFGLAFTFFIRHFKRNEEVYSLIADNNSVLINNAKPLHWQDIDKIETFSRRPIGRRMNKRYLKFILKSGEQVILDASNYDIWFEDLKEELISMQTKNNWA